MKVKLPNGDIIECTVEEYNQLKGNNTPKIQNVENKVENKVRRKRVNWDARWLKIRKELSTNPKGLTIREMATLCEVKPCGGFYRDITPFINKAYGLVKIKSKYFHSKFADNETKKFRKTNQTKKRVEHQTKMAELLKLVAKYMRNNPTMTRKEAWVKAKFVFNADRGYFESGKVKTQPYDSTTIKKVDGLLNDQFPYIFPINKKGQELIQQVIRYMVAENDSVLEYYTITKKFNTVEGDWNSRLWHEFMDNIIKNSKKIIKYFNVKGNFIKIEKGNGYALKFIKW